ncbi:hypothetical protein F4780DRAFT_337369 [Xylariomycetidae sp. FL0641]|nr:hypothetical protein F4780DRAFT_337369 [Xylariomycetidae sp. FL0641]
MTPKAKHEFAGRNTTSGRRPGSATTRGSPESLHEVEFIPFSEDEDFPPNFGDYASNVFPGASDGHSANYYYAEEDSPIDAKFGSKWDEPPTPDTPTFGDAAAFPCVMNDSWSQLPADVQKAADEFAEEDLASAGKRFWGFTNPFARAAAPTSPRTNHHVRTEISVETLATGEDHGLERAPFEMAESSELEST